MNSGAASVFIVYSQHTESMFSSLTSPPSMCINTFQVIAGVLAILSAPKSPVSVLLQLWVELSSRTPPYGQYTCTHIHSLFDYSDRGLVWPFV